MPALDQDRYEVTAFAYRLIDRYGIEQAPAFLVERVRIGGEWCDGPVVANAYGRWPDEALLFGVPGAGDDPQAMYHATLSHLRSRLDGGRQGDASPTAVGTELVHRTHL